MLSWATE